MYTMTIQKFSSGSWKNCLFFWVWSDFAGFVGQKVLQMYKYHRNINWINTITSWLDYVLTVLYCKYYTFPNQPTFNLI